MLYRSRNRRHFGKPFLAKRAFTYNEKEYKKGDIIDPDLTLRELNRIGIKIVPESVQQSIDRKASLDTPTASEAPIIEKAQEEEEAVEEEASSEAKYTEQELTELKMNELREIGELFDVKDNIKKELIDKIIIAQG